MRAAGSATEHSRQDDPDDRFELLVHDLLAHGEPAQQRLAGDTASTPQCFDRATADERVIDTSADRRGVSKHRQQPDQLSRRQDRRRHDVVKEFTELVERPAGPWMRFWQSTEPGPRSEAGEYAQCMQAVHKEECILESEVIEAIAARMIRQWFGCN